MYTSTTRGEMPRTDELPVLVHINRIPFWQASTGRTFPVVAGAEDPPQPDADTEDDSDGEQFDKDRALATIRKQREREKAKDAELKAARAEAAALKAKEQQRADADKSELEKAQIKLAAVEQAHAEAQAKYRRVLIAQAIERAAQKHNARDPEVIAKLIDLDALEVDDNGEPRNAEQLVKELLKEKSYLVNSAAPQASNSGVPPTPRSNGQPGHADRVKDAQAKLIATGDYQPL